MKVGKNNFVVSTVRNERNSSSFFYTLFYYKELTRRRSSPILSPHDKT
jgi:hypothetical protein